MPERSHGGREIRSLPRKDIASGNHHVFPWPQVAELEPVRRNQLPGGMSPRIVDPVDSLLVAGEDAEHRPSLILGGNLSPKPAALLALDIEGEFFADCARLTGRGSIPALQMSPSVLQDLPQAGLW